MAVSAVYVALALARAFADRPMVDEAWLASPALNLAFHGFMGTSILEGQGTYWQGIDRYTYWVMPVYPVVLAGWFKIVGFGLVSMRGISILSGLVLIVSVYVFVGRLADCKATGMLAACLLAIDFVTVRGGAMGRPDALCAALGYSAYAAYFLLRRQSVMRAFVTAQTLVALSIFTHPNGALYFLGLAMLAAIWDWRRLSFWRLAVGTVPYAVLAAGWALYIAHDPRMFARQFAGNASGRMNGMRAPLDALRREVGRYLAGASSRLRAGLLLPYACGVAGAIGIRELRRQKGVRSLLLLLALYFGFDWLFEGVKIYLYLIHLAPLYVALFAVCVRWVWVSHPKFRSATAVAVGLMAAIQLAGTGYAILRRNMQSEYLPAIGAIHSWSSSRSLVMGSAELAFGLGFDSNLRDDVKLGYATGRPPDIIVLDRRYKETIAGFKVSEPAAWSYVNELLARYSSVWKQADYELLVRR